MYAALNTHSHYSLGWGVVSPEELCKNAKEKNCTAIAITDTDNLYGLFFFLDYAKIFDIQPIVGAELTGADRRAVLLAKSREGYSNLCRLISKRKLEPDFQFDSELIRHAGGLAVLTDSPVLLRKLAGKIEHLYAELISGYPVVETLRTARALNLKPAASTRAFWIDPGDYQLHRLNRAISLNCTLHTLPETACAPRKARLLSEQELLQAFDYCPEAVENTNEIAELCRWTPDFGIVYPESEPGMNGRANFVLRERAYNGAIQRYGSISPEIENRLEHELKLIEEKGFAPVFLVVEDIVKQSPRTCGRGSAAASIVSYCLGITHVEPLKHKLFFERFINSARVDPPDIDVDFAWDERDGILDYTFHKYGIDKAAMVANHVTFQKRAAVREIAKVYGLPDVEIGAVTKRMSYGFSFIGKPITEHPALKDHGFPPPWNEIFYWAEKLEDIPRHISVHCGGVVVTPGETSNWVPTELAPKGVRVIQWEKDQTEDSGLVKIDLLGNRSLAVIRDAIEAVRINHNIEINYARWNPLDDPATQNLISRGDTMGVFYVESPATRLLQQKAQVGDYEHLTLHSSIIRPAANKFINMYLRRLKGEPYEPLHPLIGDILNDNYGIMVYQEDVTRVAMKLANFPLAEAEELRKIISKKHKRRRLIDLKAKFYEGAKQNGAEVKAIDKIWEMIMSFAGYSFCKPHSASYALVSFKSAYLRAHYPAEFMAAVISNQGGFYATFAYVSEAKRMGIRILPPDINQSEKKYIGKTELANHEKKKERLKNNGLNKESNLHTGWIRIGFMQIKCVSEESIDKIIEARLRSEFKSFEDFLARVRIKPSDVRQLVHAGCFDRLEPERTRPELLWSLIMRNKPQRSSGQCDIFEAPEKEAPQPPQYNEQTLLKQEVETLGFLASRRPLELYKQALKYRPVIHAKNLKYYVGRKVEAAGWLVTGKIVPTKDREPMEFVTFEDTTGLIETVLFPEAFRRFSHILNYTRPFRLFGKVEEEFGAITMSVERISFL